MTRAKYFHQLSPPPLDLPEIIDRIRADLSLADIWKCTQVCTIWSRQFSPFLWETFRYNRIEHEHRLERNGHLVRELITFCLRDSDLRSIARHLTALTGVTLEIETLNDPSALFKFYAAASNLRRLAIQLPDPSELGASQKALLFPVAQGALANLTKLQLIGMDNRRYAPVYQSGMIYRVLEACPRLEYLELSAIRIVDTIKQWNETYQNSFSSPNSIPVPTRRLGPRVGAHSSSSSASSWIPWSWNRGPTPGSHPHPHLARLDDRVSHVETKEEELFDAELLPPPNNDFKCQNLRILKLSSIYSKQAAGQDFVYGILKRSPNLHQLYLKSVPAYIEGLATLCPDLRLISLQDYQQNQPYAQPQIATYLKSPAGQLEKLSTVRLEKCRITTQDLQNIQPNLKQRGLKHLSVLKCEGSSAMAWANFIGQCEALESVSIDDLLFAFDNEMVINAENPVRSGVRQQRETIPSAIRWECNQIRYLDIYGHHGREGTFDYVFLVLVSKLPFLEFLGINTAHVPWLMKMEPVQYANEPGSTMATQGDDNTEVTKEDYVCEALPLGLFESVRTLSLESANRRDKYFGQSSETVLTVKQVRYLYHAFPALNTIVYNSTKCPCLIDAIEWLKKSPRNIQVAHRTSVQIETQSLGL
ncbi:hypothetical protein BG015_008173 [Linnemannia schmuckeri]|uniref:F-box domain-containing protein n=1 Tax=Linnemannia schmuckeri TaxID=64567 RepID=A0A9P5VAJ3_9FUNG|nr:hypothetical protein BG015_008173 [Linnemannia schmuckeri]